MVNPFTASREDVRDLISNSEMLFSREQFNTMLQQYSRDEIDEQITNQTGPLMEAIRERINATTSDTGKVEIIISLGLADFYFPNSNTTISFELRRGVEQGSINTFYELAEALEVGTYIDCEVRSGEEVRSFQIKRYSQAHREHTNEAFLQWIDEEVFGHYGDMRGIILVVIIQPEIAGGRSNLDLGKLDSGVKAMADHITFDEVVLTYNDRGQYFALHELYPRDRRLLVPLDWALARFRGDV